MKQHERDARAGAENANDDGLALRENDADQSRCILGELRKQLVDEMDMCTEPLRENSRSREGDVDPPRGFICEIRTARRSALRDECHDDPRRGQRDSSSAAIVMANAAWSATIVEPAPRPS